MKNNTTLTIALAALFTSSMAMADLEVSGKVIMEQGSLINPGSTIGDWGAAQFTPQGVGAAATPVNDGTESHKQEISFRMYADGDISDDTTYHLEGQAFVDDKGVGHYSTSDNYTQREGLRELYIDTKLGGGWDLRLGKQQVVWGTADGMKLLDMINPTDYSEMAQNQMEDSRIPVFMINAENGPVQVVISQPKENIFAGLNRHIDTSVRVNKIDGNKDDLTLNNGTDTGHAFIMMGPDTITGAHNGFLNIVPDLGGVANRFAGGFGGISQLSGTQMNGFTVSGFETMTMGGATNASGGMAQAMNDYGMLGVTGSAFGAVGATVANANYVAVTTVADYLILPDGFTGAIENTGAWLAGQGIIAGTSTADYNGITGAQMLQYGFASMYDTNLADNKTDGVLDTAFDYMANTSFMTFDAFTGAGSQYIYNMPDDTDVNFAARIKESTDSGLNYSLNFSRNWDTNPIINLSWRNNSTGAELVTNKLIGNQAGVMTADDTLTSGYTLMLTDTAIANGATATMGNYGGAAGQYATLRFEQTVGRVTNIGGSFDTAIETAALGPVVIRGEALYTKDAYSPVIDKDKLSYGDLVGALEMVQGDRFKFVLGADITVLTNMMISGQFIQDSNLDFIDGSQKYTADYATMSMSNGFNKATKDKNFYSLFFSKPFGASGQHRWNNILMIDDGGEGDDGYWNRFDVSFGMADDLEGTAELNHYWGNENTQFGQLNNSSNMQVGVKLSF